MKQYKEIPFEIENVNLEVYDYSEYVYLMAIVVAPENRNNGLGSKALTSVIEYAQKLRKPLLTFASSELGGNIEQLEKWYERYGFYKEQYKINSEYKYNYRIDFN